MKVLRVLLFIPGFFVAMILANLIFEILLYVINLLYASDEFSFIWEYFLKSTTVTIAAMFAGIYIYPYKKKVLPLVVFTLIEVALLSTLYLIYDEFWDVIKPTAKPDSIISQTSIVIGIIVGTGYMWRELYKGELSFTE